MDLFIVNHRFLKIFFNSRKGFFSKLGAGYVLINDKLTVSLHQDKNQFVI